MAYKCPDCNTYFYGDFCPKCAKSAADCIEMSELEIEEDKKAAKKKAGGESQAVCPKCGRVFEGLFCPFCGYGAEEAGIERLEDEEVAAQEEAFRQEDKRAEEEKKREEQEQAAAAAAAEKAEEEAVASGEKTKCPKCGKVVEGTFCPYCGTQVQQQNKCPHCGTERAKDAKFCPVCGYDYVNNTFAKQYYAFKRERRKNAGKIVKQKFSAAVSSAKVHKKRVITAVLAIAVILAIVVPVSVVFTSPVQPANVDRINIGDTQAHVVSVLGDPYNYKKGDTTFNYYSDNYLNIRKQLDEIANMDDIGSFSDLADALEKEEELNQKLETLEYKRTTVTFDEGGLVTQIVYNASIVDNVSQPKELKSSATVSSDILAYEECSIAYTLKYDDGSIVKSTTTITPEPESITNLSYPFMYEYEAYDPFSQTGERITLECSISQNPDIIYATTIDGVTYTLSTSGTLTISGSGEVNNRVAQSKDSVKSVIIGDGITGISSSALSNYTNMESITIPGSVVNIESGSLSGCNSLTSITIDRANTKYHSAGNCIIETESKTLISGCANSVIPNDGSVTNIASYAFRDCTGLTSIDVPGNVISIGEGAFSGCSSLESIIIPFVGGSIKTASDTYQYPFGYIFGMSYYAGGVMTQQSYYGDTLSGDLVTASTDYCIPSSLKSVTVTGGNILRGAFDNCNNLTNITISDSVTSIESRAFSGYSGLTSITVEQGNAVYHSAGNCIIQTASGTLIAGCKNSVIPDDGSVTSIGDSAFYNCSGLTSITIPDSVTSIGQSAFYNCSGLTDVYYQGDLSGWVKIEFGGYDSNPMIYTDNLYINGELLKGDIIIPEGTEKIGDYAFDNCSGLTSIIIPDSVTSIGTGAFYDCSGLTSITIPDSVTSIGTGAFSGCSGLTSIIIPDSVTSIGVQAFYNCSGLTSITIPDSVTSIGRSAFYNCSGLTSITITDSVTSIGWYAFEDCSSLTSIKFNGTMAQWKAISKGNGWGYDTGDFTITCTDGVLDKNGNQV